MPECRLHVQRRRFAEARAAAGRGSPARLGDTDGTIRIRSIEFVD